jgi:neutral ceramidase
MMRAGFAKHKITPSVGTRMAGFAKRDDAKGAEAIHDDLFARILYLEDEGEETIIVGFDLLFFARHNAEWLKAAIGRVLDLKPSQILLNTSHTHVGPCVDTWHLNGFSLPDITYMQEVERAVCYGVLSAKENAREVSIWTGQGKTELPVSRRRPDDSGSVEWLPFFEGEVCDNLPVCLLKDVSGKAVCLIFSVSCHPSTCHGWEISADYPGPACDQLDEYMGKECSLFLQGAGGDTKASVIANGVDDSVLGGKVWRSGDWKDVKDAGHLVASEVIKTIESSLEKSSPNFNSCLFEVGWDLDPLPDQSALEEQAGSDNVGRALTAQRMLGYLKIGRELETKAPLLIQGIRISDAFRFVAIEGEIVGELGNQILSRYTDGTTFALGYSNGTGLYLPSDKMLTEGGYEVVSHHEYGFASKLARGVDNTLMDTVSHLQERGIV